MRSLQMIPNSFYSDGLDFIGKDGAPQALACSLEGWSTVGGGSNWVRRCDGAPKQRAAAVIPDLKNDQIFAKKVTIRGVKNVDSTRLRS